MTTVYEVVEHYKKAKGIIDGMTVELKEIKRRLDKGEIDKPIATEMQREVLNRFINC